MVEWRKGHYICCVCSRVACSCLYTSAAVGLIPEGYGIWEAGTKIGSVTKGGTMVCRKVKGGF
jgi:hypothetical protein